MKTIRNIIIGLFVVLFLLATGLFVVLKTFDINKYRPRIEQEASSFLKRDVRAERLALEFSLNKGLTLNVRGVSVADAASFSSIPIFFVDTVYANVDALAYLLRREVVITAIELNGPRFNLIRDEEGDVNVQELAAALPQKTAQGPLAQSPTVETPSAGVKMKKGDEGRKNGPAPFEMLIRAIRMTEGEFTFVDRTFEPAMAIAIKRIDARIKDFSLSRPFDMRIDCSLWSEADNVHVQAQAQIIMEKGQLRFNTIRLETDLAGVRLSRTPWYSLLRESLGMGDGGAGRLLVDVRPMVVGGAGLEELSLDGQLVNGRVSLEILGTPLENIQAEVHVTEKDLELKRLLVEYALGKVSAVGKLEDYLGRQNFSVELNAQDLQLAKVVPLELMPILDNESGPVHPEGRIYMDIDAQGQGLTEESIRRSLSGSGFLEVRDGKVRNLNLLRLVLDKLSFVPDLARKLEESLPPKYQDRIARNETPLEKVSAGIKLQNAVLVAEEVILSSEDVLLTAKGRLDLDQNLTLEADFYIPEELSSHMTKGVEELSYLLDEEKRIHVPFKPYQGKLADFRIYPDVKDVGRMIFENKGKEELKKAILKAIGVEEDPSESDQQPPQPSGSQGEPSPEGQRPEEILIEGIFDAIFKGGQEGF